MFTLEFRNTRFNVNADGSRGQINLVTWNAAGSDETVVGRINGRGTEIPAEYAPAQVPYDTVTHAMLDAWVRDLEDEASIDAQVQAEIDKSKNPVQSSGLPWYDNYPLWVVGVDYAVDAVVIYQDIGYECIQAHTSASTWAPPATPALWKTYVPESEGPQPWVQPAGGHDAYNTGDQVTHLDKLWQSDIDANVWEPGVSGWTDITPA